MFCPPSVFAHLIFSGAEIKQGIEDFIESIFNPSYALQTSHSPQTLQHRPLIPLFFFPFLISSPLFSSHTIAARRSSFPLPRAASLIPWSPSRPCSISPQPRLRCCTMELLFQFSPLDLSSLNSDPYIISAARRLLLSRATGAGIQRSGSIKFFYLGIVLFLCASLCLINYHQCLDVYDGFKISHFVS